MKRRALVGLAAAVVGLSACSGVPSSSAPQVIGGPVGASSQAPTDTPQPNAEPRAIVQEFLRANAVEPRDPRGARAFLTPDEQHRWSDRTVTVLSGSIDDAQVGVAKTSAHSATVSVEGTQIGSLNAAGEYQPVTTSTGTPWQYTYSLQLVKGQSRISDAQDGLVIYADDFQSVYQPVLLYFLDLREKRLVPDLRYTGLRSRQASLSWALNQLINGPRPDLTNAVRTELPSLPPATPASVALNGMSATVDVPGSSRLETDVRLRLAAQLLATMRGVLPQVQLNLTDGGLQVDIPGINDPIGPGDFTKLAPTQTPDDQTHFFDTITPPLFYVDGSDRLVTASGKPVDGPLGTRPDYHLNSVAVTSTRVDPSDYYVAATIGSSAHQTLWLGTAGTGLHQVANLSGRLTRPSWLAGQREVWIANGANLYRVDYSGQFQKVPTTLLAGSRITAMRLSPEGSRIAMIVQDSSNQQQLYVGSIVRTDTVPTQGSSAQVDGADAILPPNYRLTDVAWASDTTLWVTGALGSEYSIWSVNVDGSAVTDQHASGLPQRPVSITAGHDQAPWVSADGYVFTRGTDWEEPGHHTTRGRNPIYQDSYLD